MSSYLLENKKVITRKPHICAGCYRKFEKGTELLYQKQVEGKEFYEDYYCKTCQEFVKRNINKYNFDEPYNESFITVFEEEWDNVRFEMEEVDENDS